jgi:glycerate 2-kinase
MPIRILIAPNSFKGSADAETVYRAFREGVYYYSNISALPVETRKLLICDGGTGFAGILASKCHSSVRIQLSIRDPLFREIDTFYYRSGDLGIIESAESIGYALLERNELHPLSTSSIGLGQCIAHAIDNGAKRLLVGCGDTATSDCGIGLLGALGVTFFDASGQLIEKPIGKDLARIRNVRFDSSPYYGVPIDVQVACNLTSLAAGPKSTALVYSIQKGASEEQAQFLHSGFERFTALVADQVGEPCLGHFPGSGAAGGVGFALAAFFQNCRLRYSFDVVFDAIGIDPLLEWADVVITGEGLFDRNSVKGKAPVAVALRAKLFGVTTIAIVGAIQSDITSRVLRSGFDIIEPFSSEHISLEEYCSNFDGIARDATVRALTKARPLFM